MQGLAEGGALRVSELKRLFAAGLPATAASPSRSPSTSHPAATAAPKPSPAAASAPTSAT